MTEMIGQITKEELRRLIGKVVEEKLVELFGDPDEELEINDALKKRLLQQKEMTAMGARGEPLNEAAVKLEL